MIKLLGSSLKDNLNSVCEPCTIFRLDGIADWLEVAHKADSDWKAFIAGILNNHFYPNITDDKAGNIKLLQDLNVEDAGWVWLNKALALSSDSKEYEWLIVCADSKVQGIAVLYHPTNSKVKGGEIFYIDYLATAPWNRTSSVSAARFSGVGSLLLKACSLYCNEKLEYRAGFTLHSLPKAEDYYAHIGMTDLGIDTQKENLRMFEMEEDACLKFIAAGGVSLESA